jgi:prevent-host-death family protein
MRAMTISDFRTHANKVLGQVAETKEPVVVTRRGSPVAKIVPFTNRETEPGRLANALVFERDIVSPLGEGMWHACD